MNQGYVKVWRKLQDNLVIYHDPNCLAVFIHLLFMAEYKPGRKIWFEKSQIELEPGQLTIGRKQLAKSVGLTQQNIRTALHKLQASQILTIKSTNKFSLITICNWTTYQSEQNEINQPINKQLTNKQPTSNQQVTTIKELKNLRIKEKTLGTSLPPDSFIEDLKQNKAYSFINIDTELAKMDAWFLLPQNKHRKKTKRFILNWLNRIETPIAARELSPAEQLVLKYIQKGYR